MVHSGFILVLISLIDSINGLNVKSSISMDVAEHLCTQMKDYVETGQLQEPIKSRPRPSSPDRCGWYRWGNCGNGVCSFNGFHSCSSDSRIRVNPNKRIVGGNNASPHAYPSIVVVRKFDNGVCGGTILNENWIVTAAHCTQGKGQAKDYSIVAGDHQRSVPDPHKQTVAISKIINHPQFKMAATEIVNDIALCQLATPLKLNDKVAAVLLPSPEFRATGKMMAAGWGRTKDGGSTSDILQHVELPIISDSECKSLNSKYTLTEKELCTLDKGKDGCQGDSGGPLYKVEGNRHTIVGVTSWGEGCAKEGKPGVWTEIAYFIPWIRQHIGGSTKG